MTVTEEAGPHRTSPLRATPPPVLPPAPVVSPVKARRRPALMALGVGMAALGVLSGAWLVNSAGDRHPVLTVARGVPYGAVITADDLGRADVSLDPAVATVPVSELDQIVGRVAATELVPGSLLTRQAVTDVAPPGQGQVLVAIAIPASRMPTGGLTAGDKLLVVDTPSPGAEPPTLPPTSFAATVVRLGDPDLNGVTVIDVIVTTANGPALAARSATGRIAIVLQPRGQ